MIRTVRVLMGCRVGLEMDEINRRMPRNIVSFACGVCKRNVFGENHGEERACQNSVALPAATARDHRPVNASWDTRKTGWPQHPGFTQQNYSVAESVGERPLRGTKRLTSNV